MPAALYIFDPSSAEYDAPFLTHPHSPRNSYMKTWFLLDVVSGIPFMLVELITATQGIEKGNLIKAVKTLRLLRFLKLVRLLKISKILSTVDRKVLDDIEDFFQQPGTRTTIVLTGLAIKSCK
jgi:hypothetical protein